MSITKRILFENHPEDDAARAEIKKSNWDYIREFAFRLPCRRKGPDGRWDSCWPGYLSRAAEQLGIEFVFVNEGMFFRLDEDRAQVLQRAKQLEKEYFDKAAQAEGLRVQLTWSALIPQI